MKIELKDLVKVMHNDNECVVLKVLDGVEDGLFILGFKENLKMIRLTKGRVQNCTLSYKDGNKFSWHWGMGGHTLVSDSVDKMRDKILHCIEYEFGIPVSWRHVCTDSSQEYFDRDRRLYYNIKSKGQTPKFGFEINF